MAQVERVSQSASANIAEARRTLSREIGRPLCLHLIAEPLPADESLVEVTKVAEYFAQHGQLPAFCDVPDLGAFSLALNDLAANTPFSGEVALVSGGASGIGKAVVGSLLQRGAAVVNLDINPAVVDLFSGARYLGAQVDLTQEAAVVEAMAAGARAFGGLDMLVLNAGIFPPGIRIESLETAAWQKVMAINLDPNLVLMREAHPLLKRAPRYGRVVINASKNVLAPGAGAAAYSASKAAVTQMGRVAALEWAKDGIRVNLIHPDQVFDTGIWTEEVLYARAAHYGLTVEQYKRRNLLGVEIKSRYVGEFVAEMLGPLFENITGAQIPIDGGSDRVI